LPDVRPHRLPEDACELGCGRLKYFRALLARLPASDAAKNYLRHERERAMNRRQQQVSRQRRRIDPEREETRQEEGKDGDEVALGDAGVVLQERPPEQGPSASDASDAGPSPAADVQSGHTVSLRKIRLDVNLSTGGKVVEWTNSGCAKGPAAPTQPLVPASGYPEAPLLLATGGELPFNVAAKAPMTVGTLPREKAPRASKRLHNGNDKMDGEAGAGLGFWPGAGQSERATAQATLLNEQWKQLRAKHEASPRSAGTQRGVATAAVQRGLRVGCQRRLTNADAGAWGTMRHVLIPPPAVDVSAVIHPVARLPFPASPDTPPRW